MRILQVFGVFIILWQNQYTVFSMQLYADIENSENPTQDTVLRECKPLKNTTPILRLGKYLFCDYDAAVRPNHHKTVTNVTLKLIPKIMEFDERGIITLHIWMSLSWTDAHLTWTPSDYGGVTYIHVKHYHIWVPDLNVYNSGDMSNDLFELPETDCLLFNTGVVNCVPAIKFVSKCDVDYTYWPYDQQKCRFVLGSWSHTGEEIDFHLDGDGILMNSYKNNTAWDLKFVNAVRRVKTFNCCPNETFPQIIYNFLLTRHYGITRSTLITPTIALVVLTLTVLWLDSRSVERIAVASSNFICHMLCIMNLHWQLPYNGVNTPNIMLFYRESLALATFALILTVLLRKLQNMSTKVPSWISYVTMFVLNNKAGRFLILNNEESKISDGDLATEETSDNSKSSEKPQESASWRHFAVIVEWTSFFCVIFTYVIILIILVPTG